MPFPLYILTEKERFVLYKLFEIEKKDNPRVLLKNKLAKVLLPAKGLLQSGLNYSGFLQKIADKHNIPITHLKTDYEKESELFIKLFAKKFESFSSEEKRSFLLELEAKGLSKDQVASITALTTIGAAQLSGFGVYMLATSTVGALTSALGVTLPFAFYTSMSKVISIAIGPVGFALAAYPIYKSYKGVGNWEEFKERSVDHYDNFIREGGNLLHGNYPLAEAVFNYWAGLRIMKLHQLEYNKKAAITEIYNYERQKTDILQEIAKNKLVVNEKDQIIKDKEAIINELQEQIKAIKSEIDVVRKERLEYNSEILIKNDRLKSKVIEIMKEKDKISAIDKTIDKIKN
ncbi:hypothetical protein [Maribacter luteus]|uniref:Uncharacterized protein n=1 Tax=Maribacter luteus TaxID=2594478 RepID=A0A6I2MFU3_9FLAO|nr:hypothetical protein [Maribacter luteus]MRX62598.1 hypothetical protein [Maribacter luteus]